MTAVAGDLGRDTIHGDAGDDRLDGGGGNDNIFGQAGADVLDGGADDDFLSGGGDEDIVRGDGGNDTVAGDTDQVADVMMAALTSIRSIIPQSCTAARSISTKVLHPATRLVTTRFRTSKFCWPGRGRMTFKAAMRPRRSMAMAAMM